MRISKLLRHEIIRILCLFSFIYTIKWRQFMFSLKAKIEYTLFIMRIFSIVFIFFTQVFLLIYLIASKYNLRSFSLNSLFTKNLKIVVISTITECLFDNITTTLLQILNENLQWALIYSSSKPQVALRFSWSCFFYTLIL